VIGLDTNLLVRLAVGDDPEQTQQARRFVDRHCSAEVPGFINSVVLTEFVWVLARTYGYTHSEIAAAVDDLLAGKDRIVEHHEAVRAGVEDYRSGRLDFIDAIIGHINRAHGCEATATFDRKAAKLDGFVRVT
jgi:predicted nucleic-acid-binding protein